MEISAQLGTPNCQGTFRLPEEKPQFNSRGGSLEREEAAAKEFTSEETQLTSVISQIDKDIAVLASDITKGEEIRRGE